MSNKYDFTVEAESLAMRLKHGTRGNVEFVCGEKFLVPTLELALRTLPEDEDPEDLLKLCDPDNIKKWGLITTDESGKRLCDVYDDPQLVLFALCMSNLSSSVYMDRHTSELVYTSDLVKITHRIVSDFMVGEPEQFAEKIRAWHTDNSKSGADLVCFFTKAAEFSKDFAPEFCECVPPAVWNGLREDEKRQYARFLLLNFEEELNTTRNAELNLAIRKCCGIGADETAGLPDTVETKKELCEALELLRHIPNDIMCRDAVIQKFADIITQKGEHIPMKFVEKIVRDGNKSGIISICLSRNYAAEQYLFVLCLNAEKLPVFEKHDLCNVYEKDRMRRVDKLLQILLAPESFWDEKAEITNYNSYDICRLKQIMGKYETFRKKAEYAFGGLDLLELDFHINTAERNLQKRIHNSADVTYKREFYAFLHENGRVDFKALCEMDTDDFIETALMKPSFPPRHGGVFEDAFKVHHSGNRDTLQIQYLSEDECKRFDEELEKGGLFSGVVMDLLSKDQFSREASLFGMRLRQLYDMSKRKPLNPHNNAKLPLTAEYADHILALSDDIFSRAAMNPACFNCVGYLTLARMSQIDKSLKNGTLTEDEAKKFKWMAQIPDSNYYAWSDEQIKSCLSSDMDLEERMKKLHSNLEPEIMTRIFEKCVRWVVNHRDSILGLDDPWPGMQIFDKSYADRPSIWAKHLIEIADGWDGSEDTLVSICFALGHLREPLGGDVPIKLKRLADKQENAEVKEKILSQSNLFNRENFNKGHYKDPKKRVERCKKELLSEQNRTAREIREYGLRTMKDETEDHVVKVVYGDGGGFTGHIRF